MPAIHEVATLTSKGQITLPKPIRQALGVTFGGKVAFDLQGSQVVVSLSLIPICRHLRIERCEHQVLR